MTTEVEITCKPNDHSEKEIMVCVMAVPSRKCLEKARMAKGETRIFHVHQGQELTVAEVNMLRQDGIQSV